MKQILQSALNSNSKKIFHFACFIILFAGFTLPAYSQLTYCTATSGDCNSNAGNETISNFTLDSINNNSGCSPNSYADYTSTSTYPTLETTLVPGQTYNFFATKFHADFASSYAMAVWIDYNQNGSFTDAGEQVATFATSPDCSFPNTNCTNIIKSGSFTVPLTGTVAGVTRLRIRLIFHADAISPCGNISYGETEDYRVIITGTNTTTITTSSISPLTYCAGSPISIPFTASGKFNAGNIFTAQLSNATGSFASPVTIGTLTDTLGGTISVTIPGGTSSGTGYRIRVISSNPAATGSNNGADITINAKVTPIVTISANTGNSICAGTAVTFTATPVNGGTPIYQWKLNNNTVGSTSNSYSNNSLVNGDVITCTMTSSAACATRPTADTSITMIVSSSLVPSVTISSNPGDTVCAGTPVTFTTIPANGGNSPSYQWKVNGTIVGTTSNSYTDNSVLNGDVIQCTMTSNATCVTTNTASATSTMTVNANVTPSVTISSNPTGPVCAGTPVTFTAAPVNGGTNPTFQWKVNGGTMGSNSNTYSSNSLTSGQIVSCTLTSNALCAAQSLATTSDTIIISNNLVPAVMVAVSPGLNICQGTSVTYTATPINGGADPSYQWKLNGNNVGINSNSFSIASPGSTDTVTCTMTSDLSCVTINTVTSSIVTLHVDLSVVAGTITSSKDTICSGTVAHLSLNGNTGGSLQWQSSANATAFSNLSGATAANYASNPLSKVTYFRVYATNGTCSDTSLAIKITTEPSPVGVFSDSVSGPQVSFNADASTGSTSYFWDFGDGKNSTDKNPVHNFDSVATFHVCLTVKNSSNCNFTVCQNVSTFPTGTSNINGDANWQVYPDPFTNQLYVNTGQGTTVAESVELYDVLGRKVFERNINGAMEKPMHLNLPDLKDGVYYLRIKTKDNDFVKSVIKQ